MACLDFTSLYLPKVGREAVEPWLELQLLYSLLLVQLFRPNPERLQKEVRSRVKQLVKSAHRQKAVQTWARTTQKHDCLVNSSVVLLHSIISYNAGAEQSDAAKP